MGCRAWQIKLDVPRVQNIHRTQTEGWRAAVLERDCDETNAVLFRFQNGRTGTTKWDNCTRHRRAWTVEGFKVEGAYQWAQTATAQNKGCPLDFVLRKHLCFVPCTGITLPAPAPSQRQLDESCSAMKPLLFSSFQRQARKFNTDSRHAVKARNWKHLCFAGQCELPECPFTQS